MVLDAIVDSSPAETNSKCNEAWLGSVISGTPQVSDSVTRESGISGALYKPNAIGVGGTVTVAKGFGVADGAGEGVGFGGWGVFGSQETTIAANNREARMRARFDIGGVQK